MIRHYGFILLISALLLFNVRGALAASVSVASSGDGVFIINGDGMDTVAGIDLTVNYDSTSLSSPKVSQGSLVSGAMMAANTNNPGSIKIAIISTRPFSGSGQIALISFATHTGTGRMTVSTSLIDSKGATVSGGGNSAVADSQTTTTGSSGFIQSPGVPFSPPNTTTAGTTTSTATTTGTSGLSSTTVAPASSIPTYLGTVSMPTDVQTRSDTKPADITSSVPVQVPEPMIPKPVDPPVDEKQIAEPQKTAEVTMTSYTGILEKFRAYKGEKTPAILVTLFNTNVAPSIRQEPFVALSDGKTTIKIKVTLKSAAEESLNFALNGATQVSLHKDDASSAWIVEVLPQSNLTQAGLTILTASSILEFPLTVAPPVEGISTLEDDFVIFLKDSGSPTPTRDLNGDGKHDYLDDFIFTANYLVRKGTVGKAKK